MTKQTFLQINDEKINLKGYLSKLNPKECDDKLQTIINIEDYENLGYMINSLIGVCQTALLSYAQNEHLTEIEKENTLGSSSRNISDLLELAKNLLPFSEFELLTKIHKATYKTPDNGNN